MVVITEGLLEEDDLFAETKVIKEQARRTSEGEAFRAHPGEEGLNAVCREGGRSAFPSCVRAGGGGEKGI